MLIRVARDNSDACGWQLKLIDPIEPDAQKTIPIFAGPAEGGNTRRNFGLFVSSDVELELEFLPLNCDLTDCWQIMMDFRNRDTLPDAVDVSLGASLTSSCDEAICGAPRRCQ